MKMNEAEAWLRLSTKEYTHYAQDGDTSTPCGKHVEWLKKVVNARDFVNCPHCLTGNL